MPHLAQPKRPGWYVYGTNVASNVPLTDVWAVYVTANFAKPAILARFRQAQIEPYVVGERDLTHLVKSNHHQNIVIHLKPFRYTSLETIVTQTADANHSVILMLDQIQNPYNLGAIIRSAQIYQVAALVISKHQSAPLNATVAHASAGTCFTMPICVTANLTQALAKFQRHRFWSYALTVAQNKATLSLPDVKFDQPTVLLLGNEHEGIRTRLQNHADYALTIPMLEPHSFNVAVASAIALYAVRQSQGLLAKS